MRSQIRGIFLFFLVFILVIDGIAFTGLWYDFPWTAFNPIIIIYWGVPLAFLIALQLYGRKFLADNKPGFFAGFYVFTGFFLAVYVPKIFYTAFILLEFACKLVVYPVLALLSTTGLSGEPDSTGQIESVSQLDSVSHLQPFGEFLLEGPLGFISMIVLPLSLLAFFVIIWGMLFGRFNFKVRHHEIESDSLPEDFDGFRLVHISDLHLGSLYGHEDKIRKAVGLINGVSADLVLFTGDLVNNLASEAEGWTDILSSIKSRYGNYSILGNHDYGEYYNWPDENARQSNLEQLIRVHRESGFTPLLNQSVRITNNQEKNTTKPQTNTPGETNEIYVSGVENWGLPPFKQYGDLDTAMKNIPADAFTILLSHDPSHWDEEVVGRTGVKLTLSGHTHGMQFGIRTKRIRWSPVQWKYPKWIGMYSQGDQHLHVTPGLGYIGYAGRIWIPPEISVITLRNTAGTVK